MFSLNNISLISEIFWLFNIVSKYIFNLYSILGAVAIWMVSNSSYSLTTGRWEITVSRSWFLNASWYFVFENLLEVGRELRLPPFNFTSGLPFLKQKFKNKYSNKLVYMLSYRCLSSVSRHLSANLC